MGSITQERANALVGQHMRVWGILELGLDRLIAAALGLTREQSFALARVLQLGQKTDLLKWLVGYSILGDVDRGKCTNVANRIGELSSIRNVVAHSSFSPIESGAAVYFHGLKSRNKKYRGPNDTWGEEDFEAHLTELVEIGEEIMLLEGPVKLAQVGRKLAEVLSAVPTEASGGLLDPSNLKLPDPK